MHPVEQPPHRAIEPRAMQSTVYTYTYIIRERDGEREREREGGGGGGGGEGERGKGERVVGKSGQRRRWSIAVALQCMCIDSIVSMVCACSCVY